MTQHWTWAVWSDDVWHLDQMLPDDAPGSATVTGVLVSTDSMSAATVTCTSTVTGSVVETETFTVSISGSSSVTGTLYSTDTLFGWSAGVTTITSILRAAVPLEGDVECEATVAEPGVDVNVMMDGLRVMCSATPSGNLETFLMLTGDTVSCSATVGTAALESNIVYLTSHILP